MRPPLPSSNSPSPNSRTPSPKHRWLSSSSAGIIRQRCDPPATLTTAARAWRDLQLSQSRASSALQTIPPPAPGLGAPGWQDRPLASYAARRFHTSLTNLEGMGPDGEAPRLTTKR